MNPGIYGLPSPTVVAKSVDVYEFFRSSAPPDASGGAGSWVWTPPANAKTIEFLVVGPGAGGGSGRRAAAGSSRWGGGGGGGGNVILTTVRRSLINTPLTISIPAGGAGGAAVTTDDTNGNAGSTAGGGNATIVTFNGFSWLLAASGASSAGGAGTASGGAGGTGGSGAFARTFLGMAGGASSVTGNGVSPTSSTQSIGTQPVGGCGGGGISSANVAYNGGTFSAAGLALAAFYDSLTGSVSGGSASLTAAGGSGSNGLTYGCGGSGGAASANGFASGAGGNGGDGFVRITVWY